MEFVHLPVMPAETIKALNINPTGTYVDGTLGGGGHSKLILKSLSSGMLIGLDKDPDAIKAAGQNLKDYKNIKIVNTDFSDIKNVLANLNIDKVDGILLDVGVSSYQLDKAERGFSFHNDAPLDMRMSQKGATAADLVNNLSKQELVRILRVYGEEKYANSIANAIEKYRRTEKILTTLQLAEIIKSAVPAAVRREGHPARKTFQAVRISLNKELEALEKGVNDAFECLKIGGRLSVITFHSLEDRIVKQKFAEFCIGCTCPKQFPVCICKNTPKGELANKKPIIASEEEVKINPRSRSAKLRTIEKIR